MNQEELKIQALLESLGEQTRKYENRIAELRVEITILRQQNEDLSLALKNHYEQDRQEEPEVQEVIEGEVVQEEE